MGIIWGRVIQAEETSSLKLGGGSMFTSCGSRMRGYKQSDKKEEFKDSSETPQVDYRAMVGAVDSILSPWYSQKH